MAEGPLITAIVSTYGAERFIRGCLEDLEAQTIADRLEIVVIDSNSPQREGEIVRELQQRYPNISYIRTEQRETLYKAWNRGIAVSRGRYVTNANTDDRHRHDALEVMVRALENDRGAALAYADAAVTLRENDTTGLLEQRALYLRFPRFDRRLLFQVPYVGPQPVWRRELHDRYGAFDDSFVTAADYEWWLRLAAAGERFIHVPRVLGLYLAARSSIEHRNPQLNWRECEEARARYWDVDWGARPRPHGFYLRVAWRHVLARALRGDVDPLREIGTHARMLVHGRIHRGAL